MNSLCLSEKRTIFQILTLIMKADLILKPAEVSYLDKVFEDFNMCVDEFDHMEYEDFEELANAFSSFPNDKKEYARLLFREMAECDGYVDPRELALIERFK